MRGEERRQRAMLMVSILNGGSQGPSVQTHQATGGNGAGKLSPV